MKYSSPLLDEFIYFEYSISLSTGFAQAATHIAFLLELSDFPWKTIGKPCLEHTNLSFR
jgi:hypothetical protein